MKQILEIKEENMNGVILGAIFSWGCRKALDLGISDKLKEYAESQGKSLS